MSKSNQNEISISWHIDDILHQDDTLSEDQARQILHILKYDHDATIGINWDVIDCTIQMYRDGVYG